MTGKYAFAPVLPVFVRNVKVIQGIFSLKCSRITAIYL